MAGRSLDNKGMIESDEDFGAAYESYSRPIYRYFYWRTQDDNLSEDLTSSVFEKAWRKRSSFKEGSIRAWLYRIARNLLIDQWRAKKELSISQEESLVDTADELSSSLDSKMAAEKMHNALLKLPDDMRSVVYMRFSENLSAKQVAKLLGMSEGNVRVMQYRALKKLRNYYGDK